MNINFFLRSLLIGFSIAAPVGPIGILCIRRSLAEGRLAGLVTGLGAATADAFYGSIAAFGLTIISGFLIGQAGWIRLVGGLFLAYLGIKILLSKPAQRPAQVGVTNLAGAYSSTLLLTLTNPMTILSFAAIFAGLGAGLSGHGYGTVASVVLGVFTGSAGWWLLLSTGASLLRSRLTSDILLWVNRVSGLIVLIFAIVILAGIKL
ncbi:MAG TPA: LysE family transporter [Anaerolineaceae bacterium]|nr:LysE family transporter [Anaerolineaceae bacterium]